MKHPRVYMNQEGASPGGGATPPAPADPAAQQGTQPAAPAIPIDALKSVVAEVIAGALPDVKNGIFADLRKAGVFKQEKPTVEHPPQTPPEQKVSGSQAATTGISMADVEAMLERERVITARATKHELSDAQIRRMKAALAGVAVESFATEADAYLADMGLVKEHKPPPVTNNVTQQLPASTGMPISDKGSPAPGGVLDYEREFADRPFAMSAAARQRMDAKMGVDKARAERVKATLERFPDMRVTFPKG